MATKRKFYVVWEGRAPGVYDSWEECRLQVEGFTGAKYRSFDSQESAVAAFRGNPKEHLAIFKAIGQRQQPVEINYDRYPEIIQNAIAVDAACSGNPGPVEYQGVYLPTGQRLFHHGPMQGGTNNMGEFLAIVHALAWLDQQQRLDVAVYTDSTTALGWVQRKAVKTKILPSAANAEIFGLLNRAIAWLNSHPRHAPVYKWETDRWGEIPADFGRK